jgi:hypothetical protein
VSVADQSDAIEYKPVRQTYRDARAELLPSLNFATPMGHPLRVLHQVFRLVVFANEFDQLLLWSKRQR